jgi:hypothetical protein
VPFILDEDRALKQKLQGQYVYNYANGKQFPIDVYFRFPDPEERERRFPHIAIDLIGIEFDADRAHRALGFILPADLETATPPSGEFMTNNDMPLPWTLIYQLGAYARDPVQDRQLTAILYQLFPEQFGFLDMAAYDGTVRRADLHNVVRRDTVDNSNKRLYRNIFTIGVSSEFYVYEVQYVLESLKVDLDVEGINTSINDNVVVTSS